MSAALGSTRPLVGCVPFDTRHTTLRPPVHVVGSQLACRAAVQRERDRPEGGPDMHAASRPVSSEPASDALAVIGVAAANRASVDLAALRAARNPCGVGVAVAVGDLLGPVALAVALEDFAVRHADKSTTFRYRCQHNVGRNVRSRCSDNTAGQDVAS
jgi:hypothetical protein